MLTRELAPRQRSTPRFAPHRAGTYRCRDRSFAHLQRLGRTIGGRRRRERDPPDRFRPPRRSRRSCVLSMTCATRHSRGACMKTRNTSGRAPRIANAPRPTITQLPFAAYSRTARRNGRDQLFVQGFGRRRLRRFGRRSFEAVDQPFAQRSPRIFAGFHLLGRDAQPFGNHDWELPVDVAVTQRAGRPLRDRERAGSILVRDRDDHRKRNME